MGRLSEALARGAHAMGVVVARAAPGRLRKAVEDRVFYVIFQKTRVENDAYGWRPPPPGPRPDGASSPAPERASDP